MDIKDTGKFVQDSKTGLFVPRPASNRMQHPLQPGDSLIRPKGVVGMDSGGVTLEHDSDTGIAFWPTYASGFDDILLRAMVGGYMSNATRTPVAVPMLSTIVAKRQAMVGTWQIIATGRDYPTRKALEVISMANDGQGASSFSRDFIGALDVDNRGAFFAYAPFPKFKLDQWHEYGMDFVRIGKEEDRMGYLSMSDRDFRVNRSLWAVDGMLCYPTGVPEWPYWIYVEYDKNGRSERKSSGEWVLINRRYGGHRRQHAGPKNTYTAGFGQSGAWRFSPFIVKTMAIDRLDWEQMIASPPRGIAHASGLDTPDQFADQIAQYARDKKQEDVLLYPGVIFLGTVSDVSKVSMIPWSEPPHGYNPVEWANEIVSNLAACFHMNETHLRLRLGEGALTQSGVAEAMEAETVMAWMRNEIAGVYNDSTPRSVLITANWLSDRQRRFQVETFASFATAVRDVQREVAEPILSVLEIRAMMEGTFGLEIPEVDEGDEVRHDNGRSKKSDGDTAQESDNAALGFDFAEAMTCQLSAGDRCIVAATGTPVTAVSHVGDTVEFAFDWDMYTGASPRSCLRSDLLYAGEYHGSHSV